jgi:hypothetical protein
MKILKHLQLTKKFKIITHKFQTNYQQINFFLNIFFHMNFQEKRIKSIIFVVIDFIRITFNTKHIIYMNIKYLKY